MECELTSKIESISWDNAKELEVILDEHKCQFHKQHYLILIIKWLLLNIYGRKPGYLNHELPEQKLADKVRFCQDYLSSLDIIDPGLSHNRGRTLWELYSAKVFLLTKQFQTQQIDKYFLIHFLFHY